MSAVAELEASLQALLANKPPGVTKARISSITTLCVENIKSESVLVQKIWTHFKRTPATHKLGVLYVLDSVVREWISKAINSHQEIGKGSNAPDGTFAAGVNKVTDLLPSFMNDLIATAPNDQKDKILKLVGIWDRGNTFPKQIVSEFESKLAAHVPRAPEPTAQLAAQAVAAAPALPQSQQPSPIDILSALQQPVAPQTANSQLPPNGLAGAQPSYGLPVPLPGQNPAPALQPPYNPYAPQPMQQQQPLSAHVQPPAPQGPTNNMTPEGLAALSSILPPSAMTDPAKLQRYLQTLQQLVTMGVPAEQWKQVIAALEEQDRVKNPSSQQAPVASPLRQDRRDRSRSPGARNGSGQNAYGRERSPPHRRSPPGQGGKLLHVDPTLPPDHIKVLSRTLFVGGTQCPESELRDIFLRFGNVQSVITNSNKRHAFVKMCTRPESERAKAGMDMTEDPAVKERARSVRWGVGFGPRECCDYDTGISVIPIHRLTDADRRWIVTAEYGGNGGQEIAGGQVMEEPDIEIGAGVSSKAISLKVGASAQADNRRAGGGRNRRFNDKPQVQQNHQQQQPQQHQQQQMPALQQQQQQQQAFTLNGRQNNNMQGNGNNPNFDRVSDRAPRRRDEEPNIGGAPPAVPGFGFQFPGALPQYGSAQPPFGL